MTTSPQRWYMGGVGADLLRGGVDGEQDGDTPIAMLGLSNLLALAGIGGEAAFYNLRVAITHANTEDWTFTITPVVDGAELTPIPVTLEAVEGAVSKILEISLMQPYEVSGVVLATYAPRGQWLQIRLTADEAPSALVAFDGVEVEYDVVLEGKGATNATAPTGG